MATLTMNEINKSFNGVAALKNAHFEIRGGEIHALLGANGAGKSTLMKILSGAYQADSGSLDIDGQPIVIKSPAEAKRYGIQCVYQEVDIALVPSLTVAENILLDQQAGPHGKKWIGWGSLYNEAEKVLESIGYPLPVRKKAEQLTLSEKQMVLIARAAAQNAKFVIFDEPTAPLSIEETDLLFSVIRRLKEDGVGCIFISHRLPEVFALCDRITVMRDGSRVQNDLADNFTMDAIIEAMLGIALGEEIPKKKVMLGESLLVAKNVRRGTRVRGANLTVRRGEILGVVGLVGAGKSELSRILFAADRMESGEVYLHGKKIALKNPQDAIEKGIVLVPEERRKEGLLVEESVRTNTTLATLKRFTRLGFVNRKKEQEHTRHMVQDLGIKTPTTDEKVGFLSGGNQQKVVISKWLDAAADVFLLDEPTKGVDVGAKQDIFNLIGRLAQEGKGVVYFSCELNEILGISDRIAVMYDGRIVRELSREEATAERILLYASGGSEQL
ncbi:sugar ABC transporter ATP-binding protein [Aneurinibacillus sp. Ricciae_BoGa-3]|uniref:sugar ABC transporter ATP-binding protein n=1 Tax=Aneurinibacillus sp. Ricciae_BoGa-3 TaxID=3022697 RepID=UPI002340DFBF|nr:sugar ABC transporter ATP-binding protein [Aneurinibacillus sp. Ricciae_BoGa-3]WCK55653.1 sugar ABC transporter ATP-binding protein [Aneurinibacillus sp. Ricciae_BoGa-3]